MESTEFSIGFGTENKPEKKKKQQDSTFKTDSKIKYVVFNSGFSDVVFNIGDKRYEFKRNSSKEISNEEYLELADNNVFDFYRGTLRVDILK